MATKKFTIDWSETGKTVYIIVRRESDGYYLQSADGTFSASISYVSMTEDGSMKGRYELSESRTTWTDGRYTSASYKQSGGSPTPASDVIIGSGDVCVANDAEIIDSNFYDEAFGRWVLDPVANTLTLFKADGVTVLKVFNLGSTSSTVPTYISRS